MKLRRIHSHNVIVTRRPYDPKTAFKSLISSCCPTWIRTMNEGSKGFIPTA